jgi:hypothetical protein
VAEAAAKLTVLRLMDIPAIVVGAALMPIGPVTR